MTLPCSGFVFVSYSLISQDCPNNPIHFFPLCDLPSNWSNFLFYLVASVPTDFHPGLVWNGPFRTVRMSACQDLIYQRL